MDNVGNQPQGWDEVIYRNRRGWVPSDRLIATHPLEVDTVDVGQGNATFIVTPGSRVILMDGGREDEAFQFFVWKYRLDLPTTPPLRLTC